MHLNKLDISTGGSKSKKPRIDTDKHEILETTENTDYTDYTDYLTTKHTKFTKCLADGPIIPLRIS